MRRFHQLALAVAISCTAAAAPAAERPEGFCSADATHLCFQNGLFEASLEYQSAPGQPGENATAVQPAGGRPGYFRFDDVSAAEFWLELTGDCNVDPTIKIFSLAVTHYGWNLKVRSLTTGQMQTFVSPFGELASPLVEATVFQCPGLANAAEAIAPSGASTRMILGGGRFEVRAVNPSASAAATQLTRDTGFLSFSGSPDLLVKIVQPAGPGGFFGVVASVNDQNVQLQVNDRCTGNQQIYLTELPSTYADEEAFPADDVNCVLFEDGFETGNLVVWSASTP
jgi:hypothetical protein